MCVDRFMAAPDAGGQLTALQEIASSSAQGKFVEEGGWAIIVPPGDTADYKARADDRKAAGLCAKELAKRENSRDRQRHADQRLGGRRAIAARSPQNIPQPKLPGERSPGASVGAGTAISRRPDRAWWSRSG